MRRECIANTSCRLTAARRQGRRRARTHPEQLHALLMEWCAVSRKPNTPKTQVEKDEGYIRAVTVPSVVNPIP